MRTPCSHSVCQVWIDVHHWLCGSHTPRFTVVRTLNFTRTVCTGRPKGGIFDLGLLAMDEWHYRISHSIYKTCFSGQCWDVCKVEEQTHTVQRHRLTFLGKHRQVFLWQWRINSICTVLYRIQKGLMQYYFFKPTVNSVPLETLEKNPKVEMAALSACCDS